LKSWLKEKRIDLYLAAIIIPSIILAVFTLWMLLQQYNFINFRLKIDPSLASTERELFGFFNKASIFAFALIIFALLLILIIASYLSKHNMRRQLEVAKLKSDFVSTVSHELKTPLTSIRLLAERLLKLDPQETEKQKEYYGLILTQSYHLGHLISNILDFSKLEQEGKRRYKFEKANLTELIRQAILDYPVKYIRPDCELEINSASDLPMSYLDKEAISRALINLLDNALKVSPEGGTIKINLGKLNAKEIFIEVIDEGPGIEEEDRQKIFERFFHKGKGTGLGLTLVNHIVEGHNGRVELESQKNKGSKFRIVLPLKK
jgi:signal transduction histidine kinase